MRDEKKTKQQLVSELVELRQQVAELEISKNEHRRVEEELTAAQKYAHNLIDRSLDMIISVDRERRIVEFNQAAQKAFGYSKEEVLGKHVSMLYADSEGALEAHETARGTGQFTGEVINKRKNGGTFISFLAASPLLNEKDEFLGVMGVSRDITERKQEEEKYRQLLEDMNDGYVVVQEGKYVFVNRRFGEIIGYEPEQVLGGSVGDFRMPEDRQTVTELYDRVARDKEEPHGQYEARTIRRGGEEIICEINSRRIQYEGKPAIGVIVRDITRRKRMEEQIEHRLRIEEAVTNISRLFASNLAVDLNEVLKILGEVVSANRAYVFQFHQDGQKVDNTHEWCSPGTEPQIENLQGINCALIPWWMERLNSGENIVIPDISGLPVEAAYEKEMLQAQNIRSLLVVPIYATGGALVGFMGFDDTGEYRRWSDEDASFLRVGAEMLANYWERKRAEAILRESGEKLRLIFESVPEGIVVSDLEGNILDINEGAVQMHGYDTKEELIGRNSIELIAERDRAGSIESAGNSLETGTTGLIRCAFVRRDGSEFPAVASRAVLRDDSGRPRGFVVVTVDITEQQRMQEQLMLADRLASLGQLVSGIAHEVNNPLTSVIGFSEMLLEKDFPDDIKEDLEIIDREARRAAEVVKGLLVFARSKGTGKGPMDINSIIEEVLRLRSYEQKVSKIKVDIQFAP
ncbi:PAS domain S-box protein, partial [Chloroflexota bacterium]